MRKVQMLTKADRAKLPELYATDGTPLEEKTAVVKFFALGSGATWYGVEFDGEDEFFGYVTGLGHDELGYFRLSELESLGLRMGRVVIPAVERDRHFAPAKLGEIIANPGRF